MNYIQKNKTIIIQYFNQLKKHNKMNKVQIIIITILCSQVACIYLPPSLDNINREIDTEQLNTMESNSAVVSAESIKIAEEIVEKLYHENNNSLSTIKKKPSTKMFKMDQDTVKTLEILLEHAMRHVSVLIPSPEIKSAYEKFIDFFPPGTIGGTITIIGKELLGLLWSCIKKRRIATQATLQQ